MLLERGVQPPPPDSAGNEGLGGEAIATLGVILGQISWGLLLPEFRRAVSLSPTVKTYFLRVG